jgi:hypothetical protein
VAFGRSQTEACQWIKEVDGPNAARIAGSSVGADLVVPMAGMSLLEPG